MMPALWRAWGGLSCCGLLLLLLLLEAWASFLCLLPQMQGRPCPGLLEQAASWRLRAQS